MGGGGTAGDSSHRFDLNQMVTMAKGDNAQQCARWVMLPKRGTGSPAAGPRRKPGRIGVVWTFRFARAGQLASGILGH